MTQKTKRIVLVFAAIGVVAAAFLLFGGAKPTVIASDTTNAQAQDGSGNVLKQGSVRVTGNIQAQ